LGSGELRVSKSAVYTLASKPGCNGNPAPISLPTGYGQRAQAAAAIQLEKASVRLAFILSHTLGS